MQKNFGRRTPAEQISFRVSLFIVSLIFVLICYSWIAGDNNPPILSVSTETPIRHINQQYYVPFTVTNSGGETVEAVEIVAQLVSGDRFEETGSQEVDFLSRQEKRSGEFVFSRDPQQGKLVVRVASYKLP